MKKPYLKAEVTILEVDRDIIRMLTKKGFEELFWERLQERRKKDPCVSQEVIFNELNEKYIQVIGCRRYSCYDSFRNVRDKK